MSYENKEYILQFFEGVHEEENRAELIDVYRKAKAYDAIAINIKALRKHMLNSGKSVNAKIIETENTIKHIEAIIERTDTDD